jgi:hypothetical protein
MPAGLGGPRHGRRHRVHRGTADRTAAPTRDRPAGFLLADASRSQRSREPNRRLTPPVAQDSAPAGSPVTARGPSTLVRVDSDTICKTNRRGTAAVGTSTSGRPLIACPDGVTSTS